MKCANKSAHFELAKTTNSLIFVPPLYYFSPSYLMRDLSLLHRLIVDSLTLSGRGVPLESSGLRV